MNGDEKIVSVRSLNTRNNSSLSHVSIMYIPLPIFVVMTPDHYDVAQYVYKIDMFDTILSTDSVEVKMYIQNAADFDGESVYMASSDREEAQWKEVLVAQYLPTENCIVAKFKSSELNGQLITVVKAKPAIALTFPTASNSGVLPVYRETHEYYIVHS
jgi:hypothetical protein